MCRAKITPLVLPLPVVPFSKVNNIYCSDSTPYSVGGGAVFFGRGGGISVTIVPKVSFYILNRSLSHFAVDMQIQYSV